MCKYVKYIIHWQSFIYKLYAVEPLPSCQLVDRKKEAVVKRFKQESMYGPSAKKVAVVKTMAVSGVSTAI